MTTYQSAFALTETVYMDRDTSLKGYVTAIRWSTEESLVEVSWIHGGAPYTAWFSPWRLTSAEGRQPDEVGQL